MHCSSSRSSSVSSTGARSWQSGDSSKYFEDECEAWLTKEKKNLLDREQYQRVYRYRTPPSSNQQRVQPQPNTSQRFHWHQSQQNQQQNQRFQPQQHQRFGRRSDRSSNQPKTSPVFTNSVKGNSNSHVVCSSPPLFCPTRGFRFRAIVIDGTNVAAARSRAVKQKTPRLIGDWAGVEQITSFLQKAGAPVLKVAIDSSQIDRRNPTFDVLRQLCDVVVDEVPSFADSDAESFVSVADDQVDTGTGDTGAGDTGTGDTGAGDTCAGDTGTGDTGTGDTGTGDTGGNNTGVDSKNSSPSRLLTSSPDDLKKPFVIRTVEALDGCLISNNNYGSFCRRFPEIQAILDRRRMTIRFDGGKPTLCVAWKCDNLMQLP
eukprot:CAMPEP_0113848168 /NCGR_PEP_ID=MMETSP0372-20130328/2310_1 /TAXON_ID=340204 /ORGANISM="Lankesteria abbotti" /LENGTH=372 /DNA_ID=CAMNT_0000817587 /DNA_START=341 /DNA_END=1455 /DNA_ORIENTATION=+ /assembly_acc=CAM_ASM_000359